MAIFSPFLPVVYYIPLGIMNAMGTLSIVATPIGNLEDITLRAIRTFTEADVVYCEDTRMTAKLLQKYDIKTPLKRLDANTELEGAEEIIERLQAGEHVAYATDAGTPGISDPGTRLVARVREVMGADVHIEAIPGASALTAALSIAGITTDSFVFRGFPPHKKGRQTLMQEIANEERMQVLYESPHRIEKLLAELAEHIGERRVAVARELTKLHEEFFSGSAVEVATHLTEEGGMRGEFVVIIAPISRR